MKLGGWRAHALWAAALAMTLLASYCQAKESYGHAAVQDERLRVSDSIVTVLRKESSALAQLATRQADSLTVELTRWRRLKERIRVVERWDTLPPDTVAGPERIVVRDSVRPPTLEEIMRQADLTIGRCTDALGTCTQRVANAELRAAQFEQQRDAWRRRAQPSLWDQIKQLPGRAITSTGLVGAGYAFCAVTTR